MIDEDLIDRIYECAFVPEEWPRVLDALADIATARGGVLFAANNAVMNCVMSDSMAGTVRQFLDGGYFSLSQRAGRAFAARHPGFIGERDIFVDDELASDPLYRDVLYPAGLGWCAATVIAAPSDDWLVMTLERERGRGPVDDATIARLDGLRPHLARSMLTAARLQFERAAATTSALALMGLPALVVSRLGKVMAANALIEGLDGFLQWRAADRLSFADRAANTVYQNAVKAIHDQDMLETRSFAASGAAGAPPIIAHLVPVRRAARDVFGATTAVLILTPLGASRAPSAEMVQTLFDFTPAEARVARGLVAGQSAARIAGEGGVALATVRSQVRGVLEKTGCTRQAELVALLGGIAVPGNESRQKI